MVPQFDLLVLVVVLEESVARQDINHCLVKREQVANDLLELHHTSVTVAVDTVHRQIQRLDIYHFLHVVVVFTSVLVAVSLPE